jgi:UDP-4-amino-4,6-dideoxy-N-acetyl-beta-L-altrosamine N-acetyltransferase
MSDSYSVRAVMFEDLPIILSWRNHPEVRRYMLTQHEITLGEHQNWFANVSRDIKRHLLIVESATQHLGYVQFSQVALGGTADWGFYTNPEAPKGVGKKLGHAALSFAFDTLHLHKVCGQALNFNDASRALHIRLGFSHEGTLRDQCKINDVYHDLICYGLINEEWRASARSRKL